MTQPDAAPESPLSPGDYALLALPAYLGGPMWDDVRARCAEQVRAAVAQLRAKLRECDGEREAAVGLLRDADRALRSDSMKSITGSAWAHGVMFDPKDACDGKAIEAFLAALLAKAARGDGGGTEAQ